MSSTPYKPLLRALWDERVERCMVAFAEASLLYEYGAREEAADLAEEAVDEFTTFVDEFLLRYGGECDG